MSRPDHRGGPGLPGHAALSRRKREVSAELAPDPVALTSLRTRRCSPTRSAWRSLSYSTPWSRPSGWHCAPRCLPRSPSRSRPDRGADPPHRQLASRARRRVQSEPGVPDPSAAAQIAVVSAFLAAAAREGKLSGLLQLLDPHVVLPPMPSPSGRPRGGKCRGPGAARGDARYRWLSLESSPATSRQAELGRRPRRSGGRGRRPADAVFGFTVRDGGVSGTR